MQKIYDSVAVLLQQLSHKELSAKEALRVGRGSSNGVGWNRYQGKL